MRLQLYVVIVRTIPPITFSYETTSEADLFRFLGPLQRLIGHTVEISYRKHGDPGYQTFDHYAVTGRDALSTWS